MKRRVFILLPIFIALAALATWVVTNSRTSTKAQGLVVEASSHEVLQYVRGLKAPVVLVNFWATWCAPCREEFPTLLKLREKFSSRGLKVVFVSIDEPNDLPEVEAFLNENGIKFQSFFKGKNSLTMIKEMFPQWEGAVPTTLLIGPDLKILDAWEGDKDASDLESHVAQQLKGS